VRLLLLLLVLGSLAVAEPGRVLRVTVVTEPPGADLYLEVSGRARYEKYIGRSGEELLLDPTRLGGSTSYRITTRLSGYHDRTETLGTHFSGRWPAQGAIVLQPVSRWAGWRATLYRAPLAAAAGALAAFLVGAALWRRERRLAGDLARLRTLEELRPSPLLGVSPRVGSWRLVELLGRGGLASVYRAVPDDTLDPEQAVAVKVLDQPLDPEVRARYRREVLISARLSHPALVRLLDFGEQSGLLYLVLELVDGGTLRQHMRAEGLPLAEALEFLLPLMEGLRYAHSEGVIHRDLKPENVLITSRRQVKLADFGLARALAAPALTGEGQLLGTAAYAAPELLAGQPYGRASDQYSLGVIAFELFAGRKPFQENVPVRLVLQQLSERPPSLADFCPDLPADVITTVDRLLEREPARRFPDLSEPLRLLTPLRP